MLDETAERINAMPLRMALGNKAPIQVFDPEYKAMQRYKRAYNKKKQKQIEDQIDSNLGQDSSNIDNT